MTGQEINSIVDKLADKLGVAVGKVEPIMQQVIDEYVLYNIIIGILCVLSFAAMLLIGFFLCGRGSKKLREVTIEKISEKIISTYEYKKDCMKLDDVWERVSSGLDPYISDDWRTVQLILGCFTLAFSCIPLFISFGYFANVVSPVANIFFKIL